MFEQHPSLLLAIIVIAIEWFVPLRSPYSIEWLLRQFAIAIKSKLRLDRSDVNLPLYGALASVAYFTIILIIIVALAFAFPVDYWTNAVLLYLSLSLGRYRHAAFDLIPMLENNQKVSAKSLLQPLSRCQTATLSELGLRKLIIELLTVRLLHGWLMPLIAYFVIGGLGCLLYVALYSAYLSWFVAGHASQPFLKTIRGIITTVGAIPSYFFAPAFSVFSTSPRWLSLFNQHRKAWSQQGWASIDLLWLAIVAAGCRCEVAGPVIIDGKKQPRERLNYQAAVNDHHIKQLLRWQSRFAIFVLGLLSTLWIILILS